MKVTNLDSNKNGQNKHFKWLDRNKFFTRHNDGCQWCLLRKRIWFQPNFKVKVIVRVSNFDRIWHKSEIRALKEDNSIIALSHYADGPKETISTAQTGIIPGTIETFRNGTHFSIGFQRELTVTKARFTDTSSIISW